MSWLWFDRPLSFIARPPCWVFIICVSALTLIFMTWHRGYASTPQSHCFLAVGMLASHQPQAFRFFWIPLSSTILLILLQSSYGDFPGSWKQNFPGDQINLESSLVFWTLESLEFPGSWLVACQGGGAPADISGNTHVLIPWMPSPDTSVFLRLPAVYTPKLTCRHSQTLWGQLTHWRMPPSVTQPSSCTKRHLGFLSSVMLV